MYENRSVRYHRRRARVVILNIHNANVRIIYYKGARHGRTIKDYRI